MIDVVGSEGSACEALQQVIFFVGSAVRADEADGFLAAGAVSGFQLGCGGLCGFFPGDREQLVTFANERLANALGMIGKIEAKAALYAEKIFVDAAEIAIVGAKDFVIADT